MHLQTDILAPPAAGKDSLLHKYSNIRCMASMPALTAKQSNSNYRPTLTSVGLSFERCSGGVLGSVTRAPLSKLGVSDEGSHESSAPAAPFPASSTYTTFDLNSVSV